MDPMTSGGPTGTAAREERAHPWLIVAFPQDDATHWGSLVTRGVAWTERIMGRTRP